MQIGQLLKYLTVLNPQGSPVRLALYNYLNHLHRTDQALTPEVINSFFCQALEYPHWQQDRMALGQTVLNLLQAVSQQYSISQNELQSDFNFSEILWPQNLQIIEVESFHDFSEVVHHHLSEVYCHGEKFRLISDQQKNIMAVVLFPEGQVRVRSFHRKMTIQNGQLQPLRMDSSLSYSSNLELSEAVTHRVDLGPYTTAQFEVVDGEVIGAAVNGYLFQKFMDFRGGPLRDHLKLFYAVKRLEQSFIDRRTDSFYLEVIRSIEHTSNLLKMGDPRGVDQASAVLANAEAAQEQVFVSDKLLGLLIRDLQNLWLNKQTPQKFV
jgi:hypothetical protein